MSYLHCPTCACAYNVAREPACPRCGVRAGTPEDPADDVVSAVEQLARAIARATPAQLAGAEGMLAARDHQLALPAPGASVGPAPALLRAVRAALAPAAPAEVAPPVATLLGALLARLPVAQQASWRALLARVPAYEQASWRALLDAALSRLASRRMVGRREVPLLPAPAAPPASLVAGSLRAARSWTAARVGGPLARAREAFARAA